MKRTFASFLVVACTLIWAPRALAQTADEVVEKHLAAMGGRAALAKLTTQIASGSVTVATPEVELPGRVEIHRKAPNKSRTHITLDLSAVGGAEMVIIQSCDGKTGFASNSMQGDREITGDQLQGMLNANFPSPLLNYKDAGGKVEFVGKDKVRDRDVYVLQYTPRAGPAARQYFDAETYLLLKAVAKVTIPDAGGEVEQVNELGDYRDVGGVKAPFTVSIITAAQTVTIKLAKIEWNTPIDDATFARAVAK